jgi:hypothetical protein
VSSNLLEKLTNGLETSLAILSGNVGQPKTHTFGEYLKSVLDGLQMSPYQVEQRSREEAKRRGVEVKAYTISDAKVGDILNEVPSNHVMSKLCGLAWAINRPIEEVAAHAFGFAGRLSDFQKSDAFRLWEVQQKLNGEEAKYYTKRIADLAAEIEHKVRLAKKQAR